MNDGHVVYVIQYQTYSGSVYESWVNPFARFYMQFRVQVHTIRAKQIQTVVVLVVNIQRLRLKLPDRELCLSSKPQDSIYQRLVLAGLSATLKLTCWLWNGEERGRPPTKPCLAPRVFVLLWTAATSCPRSPKNKTRPCSSGSITEQGHNRHRIRLFKARLAILADMHLWKQAAALKVSNEVSIWRQRSINGLFC